MSFRARGSSLELGQPARHAFFIAQLCCGACAQFFAPPGSIGPLALELFEKHAEFGDVDALSPQHSEHALGAHRRHAVQHPMRIDKVWLTDDPNVHQEVAQVVKFPVTPPATAIPGWWVGFVDQRVQFRDGRIG